MWHAQLSWNKRNTTSSRGQQQQQLYNIHSTQKSIFGILNDTFWWSKTIFLTLFLRMKRQRDEEEEYNLVTGSLFSDSTDGDSTSVASRTWLFINQNKKREYFFSDRTRPTVARIQLLNMLVDGILTKFFFSLLLLLLDVTCSGATHVLEVITILKTIIFVLLACLWLYENGKCDRYCCCVSKHSCQFMTTFPHFHFVPVCN